MNTKKTKELSAIKQDICVCGIFGSTMTVLSLLSLIATVRNPEAINIMCTAMCLAPNIYVANEARKETKKYIQLKREIKNLQR
jgi:hypothetical protein